ncbi:MAG: bacillithiol system redox-active protein YtxJ [Bacteroidota bacterium]
MGLLNWFGSKNSEEKEETQQIPWLRLHRLEQLDEIVEESKTQPVAIFKHSTRCGISRMVLRQFESGYQLDPDSMKLYFLDLLSYRDVSDEVGFKFQVLHQSPQLLIIKDGVAVAHASHHGIRAGDLQQFV